jgi:hypothetical protein
LDVLIGGPYCLEDAGAAHRDLESQDTMGILVAGWLGRPGGARRVAETGSVRGGRRFGWAAGAG